MPSAGHKIRRGCLNLALSAAKRGRNCYVTPAFSKAHKWPELLRNPCILKGPNRREKNQKWLPHHRLLRGPQVGGIAT